MGLTNAQILHNNLLDMEIEDAHRRNKLDKEHNDRVLAAHEQWLKGNPDYPFKSCPNLIITAPRKVIGIRYVE